MTNLFSVSALFIMYREALEACVVISVMLSIMGRLGLHRLKRQGGPSPRSACHARCGRSLLTVRQQPHRWLRRSCCRTTALCRPTRNRQCHLRRTCVLRVHPVLLAVTSPTSRCPASTVLPRTARAAAVERALGCGYCRDAQQPASSMIMALCCRLADTLVLRVAAVWWGAITGVLTAVLIGIIFVIIFYVLGNTVFQVGCSPNPSHPQRPGGTVRPIQGGLRLCAARGSVIALLYERMAAALNYFASQEQMYTMCIVFY